MFTRLRRVLPFLLGMTAFLFGAALVTRLRTGGLQNYLLLGLAGLLLGVLFVLNSPGTRR